MRIYRMLFASNKNPGNWSVDFATFTQSIPVGAQTPLPAGVFFKSDGTKMYIGGGSTTEAIFEYNLSTPWAVSSAVFFQSTSVAAQAVIGGTNPVGVSFKPDGTRMYVLEEQDDAVLEYSLSAAWDITSKTFVARTNFYAQETSPRDVFFKSDGTRFFIAGSSADSIHEYSLSSAWAVSSASFVQSVSVSALTISPGGVFFKPDGLKLFLLSDVSNARGIFELDLSVAWDLTTATLKKFAAVPEALSSGGLFFKGDGSEFYFVNRFGTDRILQYSLSP